MKEADVTIRTEGDSFGEGLVYMLKSCPFVKSLGKLVESGFSFLWGPNHLPTLIPAGVGFDVQFDQSQCIVAERVDHCVPVFKETVSFVHGMPAGCPASDAVPGDGDVTPILVEEIPDDESDVEIIEPGSIPPDVANLEVFTPPELIGDAIPMTPRAHDSPSSPKGADLPRVVEVEPDPGPPIESVPQPEASKGVSVKTKGGIPVDHLFCHQPASSTCDVCRRSKLRVRPHKRFRNQSSSVKEHRVIEAPTRFLERVCIDHLESTEEGLKSELYALVCVDQYSGCIMAYPAASKSQGPVELALRHFCRTELPVIVSDRYPSLLSAVRELKMVSDPSPPNSQIHNPYVESAINLIRQGTRTLLVQSGLNVQFWCKAMMCFCYHYNLITPPSLPDPSLREAVDELQRALPEGHEGPIQATPQYDSKLHMALQYQPEPRMIPFGALVWFKDRVAPKSFGPNGHPAIYMSPEVLPGLRTKDVHVLVDLDQLKDGKLREIVTRDFISPSGPWVFPLHRLRLLKQPSLQLHTDIPAPPDTSDDGDVVPSRNRNITKRRREQYGPTEGCHGCLTGTYQHSLECRRRFNALLDEAEPLGDLESGGGL